MYSVGSVCVHVSTCIWVHMMMSLWRSEGSLQDSFLFFYPWSGEQTQIIRCGDKHFNLLSNVTIPALAIFTSSPHLPILPSSTQSVCFRSWAFFTHGNKDF